MEVSKALLLEVCSLFGSLLWKFCHPSKVVALCEEQAHDAKLEVPAFLSCKGKQILVMDIIKFSSKKNGDLCSI